MTKTIFGFGMLYDQPYKVGWVELDESTGSRQIVIQSGDYCFNVTSDDLLAERAKYMKAVSDIDKALELARDTK
jgi:hypothetical protein